MMFRLNNVVIRQSVLSISLQFVMPAKNFESVNEAIRV
jgi:hypothetical protein